MKNLPPEEYGADLEALVTELMSATKRGDREAFDRLAEALRGRAFRIAHSLVGSREDAMDITQEAFLKTYRARDTYRDGDPFLPWFHRILRNTCFSFLRKHGRLRPSSTSDEEGPDWEIAGEDPAPSQGAEQAELAVVFWQGFRQLGARDREILALRHFQELSYREIAHALSIPEGTVMSRLFHARRRLRERLDAHLGGALEEYAGAAPRTRAHDGVER